jgi:hypothetical protein
MRRAIAAGLAAVLVAASGCAGPDAAARELLAALGVYAETIEKKDPPERQRAAFDRARTALDKFQKLPADEQQRMTARHAADFQRARERFEAARRTQVLEGGAEPLDVLEGVSFK